MFYNTEMKVYKPGKNKPKKWFVNLFFWASSNQKKENISSALTSTNKLKLNYQIPLEQTLTNKLTNDQDNNVQTGLLYKDLNTVIHCLMFEKTPDVIGALIAIATEVQKMQDELTKIQDELDPHIAGRSVRSESRFD